MTGSDPHPDPPAVATEPADRIIRVGDDRRLDAVERLLEGAGGAPRARSRPGDPDSSRASAERFLAFSGANSIRLDAMWARTDENGTIRGTVLAVPNPGRTAILFASVPRDRGEVSEQAALIDHASRALADMDVDLAQVLLDPRDALLQACFVEGGFHELARLSYLERPLPGARRLDEPDWPDDVALETYRDELDGEVVAVLEASYVDTLDCPGLRGLRRTRDILAGHRGTGEFDPALWTLLRVDGEACGVLMLNPAPASNTIELVYIGLAPSARGSGLGHRLLRHGLRQAATRSERAMTLAVDEQNRSAIAIYRREGFRRMLRRVALIRSVRVPAG
jgi:ribosomal protein S18 acetylase RimI-like enzyme